MCQPVFIKLLLDLHLSLTMSNILAVSICALFIVATVPAAFGDHMIATVTNAEGTSTPGCEVTKECFIPYVTTVDLGGEVIWENVDNAAHTVTSGNVIDGPDDIFDSGLFPPGATFSHMFHEPGEYPYFCLVHPWMDGIIVVQGPVEHDEHDEHEHDHSEPTKSDVSASTMLSDGTAVEITSTVPTIDESATITVRFVDSENVNYDILVIQNGEMILQESIHSGTGISEVMTDILPSSDPLDVEITFQGYGVDEMSGPVGETVMFPQIVPEFGTIAAVVLAVAIVSVVVISSRSGFGMIPRY